MCIRDSYVGLLVLHDVAAAMLEHGPEATCGQAMRNLPPVRLRESASEAARVMNDGDTAAVAVVDDNHHPCGVVSAMSLAGLAD